MEASKHVRDAVCGSHVVVVSMHSVMTVDDAPDRPVGQPARCFHSPALEKHWIKCIRDAADTALQMTCTNTDTMVVLSTACLFGWSIIWWLGGVMVTASDLRSTGRGFDSRPFHYQAATVGQLLFAPWAWAYSTLHP